MLSIPDRIRRGYVFKNRILAATVSELYRWEPEEYGIDRGWARDGMKNVEKRAGRMIARIQLPENDQGGLNVKKVWY